MSPMLCFSEPCLQQVGGASGATGVSRCSRALRSVCEVVRESGHQAPVWCVLESVHQCRISRPGTDSLWPPRGSKEHRRDLHAASL